MKNLPRFTRGRAIAKSKRHSRVNKKETNTTLTCQNKRKIKLKRLYEYKHFLSIANISVGAIPYILEKWKRFLNLTSMHTSDTLTFLRLNIS